MNKKTIKRSALSYVFLAIVILGVLYFVNVLNRKVNNLSYTEFKEAMMDDVLLKPVDLDMIRKVLCFE